MKRTFDFIKMAGSGNDFILIDNRRKVLPRSISAFARNICARSEGVGADGLLVVQKSEKADLRMRIFNADGSEPEMCGNGARCFALWAYKKLGIKHLRFETMAGLLDADVNGGIVRVRMTKPESYIPDILIKVNKRPVKVNYINTGVPHAVVFVSSVSVIDVPVIGRKIRFNRKFMPAGTNVNFVQITGKNSVRIRTYERGVEDETLSCGTGSVASALIASFKGYVKSPVNVHTKGKGILRIYFIQSKNGIDDVYLEGKVGIIYEGRLQYPL